MPPTVVYAPARLPPSSIKYQRRSQSNPIQSSPSFPFKFQITGTKAAAKLLETELHTRQVLTARSSMAASGFTPDGNPAGLVIKTILTHSDTSLHAASIHFRGGRFALHINLHQGAIGRDMLYLYLGIGWPLWLPSEMWHCAETFINSKGYLHTHTLGVKICYAVRSREAQDDWVSHTSEVPPFIIYNYSSRVSPKYPPSTSPNLSNPSSSSRLSRILTFASSAHGMGASGRIWVWSSHCCKTRL